MNTPRYSVICIFWVCSQILAGLSIPVDEVINDAVRKISLVTHNPIGINLQPIDESMVRGTTKLKEENLTGEINLDMYPINEGNESSDIDCEDQCVWYYQCLNGTINTNGKGIINLRSSNLPCVDTFQVCCKVEDISIDPITPAPPPVPHPKGCGYRRSTGIGIRITGDDDGESQFGEFPWMVALFQAGDALPKCGGALIHPQAVITAAHCVSNRSGEFSARAGEWNLNKASEPFLHQEVPVRAVKVHEEFYPDALFNDIAFLLLERPVELAANVEVVCLPPQNHAHRPEPNRCYSTGWGKDKEGREGRYQSIMKKVDLPVVPSNTCQLQLRKTRLGNFFNLHNSFMCAGGERGKDACTGDGGSPLVCPLEGSADRYYQAGIVAWGIGCGDEGVPGVYVDVAQFRGWIDEQMRLNGLDSDGYSFD